MRARSSKHLLPTGWILLLTMMAWGCGSENTAATDAGSDGHNLDDGSNSDGSADDDLCPDGTDPDPDPDFPCPDPEQSFNESDPGISCYFTISAIELMGQKMGVGAGAFQPAVREEFEGQTGLLEIPVDSCVIVNSLQISTCAADSDCAPEQQCRPEYDDDGNPIANSNHCATDRSQLDVGPFTATADGANPLTFTYNANQDGGYTSPGDGVLDANAIAYGSQYLIEGAGDSNQGLGAFRGIMRVPLQFDILTPVPVANAFGMREIEVDPKRDLELTWSDPSPCDQMDIEMTGADMQGGANSYTCRVQDDGAFTVPAEIIQKLKLGSYSLLNTAIFKRRIYSPLCGQGLSRSEMMSEVTIIMNLKKVE